MSACLKNSDKPLKILIFSWNETYIHYLSKTGYHFDVVEVEKNGHAKWIEELRPVPPNCGLINENDAHAGLKAEIYDRVICLNINDLVFVSKYRVPKAHLFQNKFSFLTGNLPDHEKNRIKQEINKLIHVSGDLKIFYDSSEVMQDWGYQGKVITPGIDQNEYKDFRGDEEKILRIVLDNPAMSDRYIRERLLRDMPTTAIAYDPGQSDYFTPASREEYTNMLSNHRVYLHASAEDGFDFAMIEAMAAGIPVVSMKDPNSLIIDGDNGYISGDVNSLKDRLHTLLCDQNLAESVGMKGRNTVIEKYPVEKFIHEWREALSG